MKNVKNGKALAYIAPKIGIFASFLVITVLAVYFYSPVIKSHAYENTVGRTRVKLGVPSRLNISTSTNNITMTGRMNTFSHDSLTVSVSTNSQYGYTLTIEDANANANMVHSDSSISNVFIPLTERAKSSEMPKNTWGYAADNDEYYRGVPVYGSPAELKRTNVLPANPPETTVVDFGVKVGSIPSGNYQDVVIFSVYANGANG